MTTPLGTPIRQAKLGIASTKSLPLANEYKKILSEQHQRLWLKHQQDLDLIDDIRSYVKARLTIEKDYTTALSRLGKQHSNHITKKFTLLNQCDQQSNLQQQQSNSSQNLEDKTLNKTIEPNIQNDLSDSRLQKRLANNGLDEPDKPCSLYKVWSEHINRLQVTSKNRADQFEQLIMVVDKLKDIRSHKAVIGKKCLDTHLKRIHEDIVVSMVDIEKARKLYYEDESQAKKARENEEKIKKKRSGILTKFTDLQAKKEKTSAQREANDIQSTQARNDYIMALAAGNAHLNHYQQRDLNDFIHLIDDGVLDHCKIFMATLSECDINSLKDALTHAQYWSKMINLTGSQRTNSIFFDCEQSKCLRNALSLVFEPCNNDPIQSISLEHNADYALQHEIDKWFTWFKKECRNLSQLIHQLEVCQRAFSEGKKSIELNGQTIEDLEPRIIDLKQQIRKSEAAKLKAQARLKVIKEGGMQIEEWSAVESEIRADMARAQEELEAKRAQEMIRADSSDGTEQNEQHNKQATSYVYDSQVERVQLQASKDSDDSDVGESTHNLASVSRSTSNLVQKQQNAISGYNALTDPSLVWQDDHSNAWGSTQGNNYNVVITDTFNDDSNKNTSINSKPNELESERYDLLGASKQLNSKSSGGNQHNQTATVQSSSPLSAIMDGAQTSQSPYQGMVSEAYKSDYECDYNRNGHLVRSSASSVEPYNQQFLHQNSDQVDLVGKKIDEFPESTDFNENTSGFNDQDSTMERVDPTNMLNRKVVALYSFDKSNEDDLAFNENDILHVIEVNDANWVKAKSELTGDVGYVPTSYIKLLEDILDQNERFVGTESSEAYQTTKEFDQNVTSLDSESAWNTQDIQQRDQAIDQCQAYCRAIYDHQPDTDTFEDDGLPHLALLQGEIMRIIDQGEDDGWWLVEKEDTGTRGHVPSMLVEEIDLNADDDNDISDDASEYSQDDDLEGSIKAMPSFEPPVLQAPTIDNADDQEPVDGNNNATTSEAPKVEKSNSSLIPTSFIIIEPTPEIESKRVEDSLESALPSRLDNNGEKNDDDHHDRQVVHCTSSKLPNDVSYSIINEDFVLEGPARKPFSIQHHETPTILEENLGDENSEAQNYDLSSKTPEGNYEPLSEVDSLDMPAPPSVVIESFEDDKQSESRNSNSDNEDNVSLNEIDDNPPVYVHKEIKHTGNVDVNPILRHRAEEFSKQIIAEALKDFRS